MFRHKSTEIKENCLMAECLNPLQVEKSNRIQCDKIIRITGLNIKKN